MEQVVVNLLTNAAKYTAEGGQIRVSVEREGDECVLCVQDTGPGITPEFLPYIFDKFTQADRTLDRSQGGLGIGLALVKRLVEMHGGHVEAHSTLGQGSEFVVRLPVMAATAPPPSLRRPPAEPSGQPRRVLIVDDNEDAATMLGMRLKAAGHTIRMVHDGMDALDAAPEFMPDVVLLDIGLPGMDGYEVARRLRQQPLLDRVVIIATTGYGQDSDRRLSEQAGFDHHLVKPADFGILKQILDGCGRSPRT
jgi:CheY-like chemotaxis protein